MLALSSDDGTDALPAVLFAVIAWSDYADGIAARVTGQYSRFGALLDPVVDRLLVISGVVVCWRFELLPRWALAVLVAREVFMLVAGRAALRRGVVLQINWWGRWSVWPLDVGALLRPLRADDVRGRAALPRALPLLDGHGLLRPRRADPDQAWRSATLKLPLSVGPALVRSRAPWTRSPTWAPSPTRS